MNNASLLSDEFIDPVVEWQPLANRKYRRTELYQMAWESVNLEDQFVVAAPLGGPIAVTGNFGTPSAASSASSLDDGDSPDEDPSQLTSGSHRCIRLFSSSGRPLSSFVVSKSKRIVGMGWSAREELVVIMDEGTVMLFGIHTRSLKEVLLQFRLGKECERARIQECFIWSTGLVVMTRSRQFFAVSNFREPRVRRLADPGLLEAPTAWTCIEPRYTLSRSVEVLVATVDGSIIVIDQDKPQDQQLTDGPFTRLALSPDGQMLATFNTRGVVSVRRTDFKSDPLQHQTVLKVDPLQLAWCGSDVVLAYWENNLEMYGPDKNGSMATQFYKYREPLLIVTQIDGASLISNSRHEFLERVPDVVESIFGTGSVTAPATLYDALRDYEAKDPRADQSIREIGDHLAEAVSACIEAVGYEYRPHIQRALLRAASFGKCFLELYDPDQFVNMCRTVRVLNCVRDPAIGIPLTYQQLKLLTVPVLIDRLINRNLHLLAWRICQYLGLKADRVLVHWACAKVRSVAEKDSAYDVQQLAELIKNKLHQVPGISFAEIASTAHTYGLSQLATLLLEYEPRAADQVPLLLSMRQDDVALAKALESGDTDLVYLVLLQMRRALSGSEFFRKMLPHPRAVALLEQYGKQKDVELLQDIYYHAHRPLESGHITVLEAYRQSDLDARLQLLQKAQQVYRDAEPEGVFASHATQDQIRLLLQQRAFQASHVEFSGWVGLSLTDTIYQLLLLGKERAATKLREAFRVPDRRFWHTKVRALADTEDWGELYKFSKSKTSPIGYRPFAQACFQKGAIEQAARYVPRFADENKKAYFYIRLGMWREAADVAANELRSVQFLTYMYNRCPKENPARVYIERAIAKLESGK